MGFVKAGPISAMALAWAFAPAPSDAQPPPKITMDWMYYMSSSAAADLCIPAKTHNNRTFSANNSSSSASAAQFFKQAAPGKTQAEIAAIMNRVSDQTRKQVSAGVAERGCASAYARPFLSFYKSHSDAGMFVGTDLPWRPDAALIARLESRVRLPRDSHLIANYARYYAGTYVDGHRVVRGIYLYPEIDRDRSSLDGRGPPGVHIVEEIELPTVYDGGCGNIAVYFDLSAGEEPRASCGDPG